MSAPSAEVARGNHRLLYRFVDSGVTAVGERQFRGNAGSADLQSDGYALDLMGGDLSRLQGGPLLWQHGKDGPDPTIGRVIEIHATATELPFLAEFLPVGTDLIADATCRKLKAGAPYGMSLGFRIDEAEPINGRDSRAGLRATLWTALELSLCTVAVDPKAVITARSRAPLATLSAREQWELERARCMQAYALHSAAEDRRSYARRQADLARLTETY